MYFIYFTESLWKGIEILNNLFDVIFVNVYHFFKFQILLQLSLCLLFLLFSFTTMFIGDGQFRGRS